MNNASKDTQEAKKPGFWKRFAASIDKKLKEAAEQAPCCCSKKEERKGCCP